MSKQRIDPAFVEFMKSHFKGISKSIISMTNNPDYYGIDFTQTARKIAGKKPKVTEHRAKPCRLYARLTTTDFRRLQDRLNGRSVQDYIEQLIKEDLKR